MKIILEKYLIKSLKTISPNGMLGNKISAKIMYSK
jgi:hypothetical protein